jgi:hypothetical protein
MPPHTTAAKAASFKQIKFLVEMVTIIGFPSDGRSARLRGNGSIGKFGTFGTDYEKKRSARDI